MDFDVTGPDGPGTLVPRVEIGARQALYLETLADSCGHPLPVELRDLLTSILGFSAKNLTGDISFKAYLEQQLGRTVPAPTLAKWEEVGSECRDMLRHRLDYFRGYSPAENPAIALPDLFTSGQLLDDDTATERLRQYSRWLEALHGKSKISPAHTDVAGELLDALADYANYYDLVVTMRVPLDEPFLVKIAERRDLDLSNFMNHGTQELVVADARTNHITFKVTDPNVRISRFRVLKYKSDDLIFQSHSNEQTRTFYANGNRDYRIRISFGLALLRRLQLVPYLAAGLLCLLGLALWDARDAVTGSDQTAVVGSDQTAVVGSDQTAVVGSDPTPVLDLRTLALIVGPAALAASVLLAREPSTLGSRLRQLSSLVLGAALLGLIATSAALYVKYIR
ncbi:hypothetical protein C5613_36565 [Rhodococcus opacus]|uniref:Uncharacterized protein n=2 Tax=Rhodococcus opacus TaxID=37919 RepID=A0A2S8INZ0_RHOOP|nr:hypothetical protein C5613_36565 [Rhodococcus opacus]